MGAALLHALLLLMIAMLLRADASTSGSVGSVAHGHAVLSTAVSDGAPRARAEMRPCAWTAPDGSLYDLSALARLGGQEDYRVNIPHSNFAMLVNLCANTLRVPTRCAGPSNTRASVGFQWDTSNDASCWELGSLDTAQWDLLDEHDPRKGVEIMFTGGTACSSGMARMVHFHMLCAEGVGDEGPSFAWEAPICSYHIVWPTIHACPRPNGGSWARWLGWAAVAVVGGVAALAWRRSRDTGEPFQGAFWDEAAWLRGACAGCAERIVGGFDLLSTNSGAAAAAVAGPSRNNRAATMLKPYRDDEGDDGNPAAIDDEEAGTGRGGGVRGSDVFEDPFLDDGDDLAPMPLMGDSI